MRIVLYLGKGGVGKTTVAAASAVRSADLGYRTLVVSTDIAHSLADSLDIDLRGTPTEVAPNLFAQEINVLDEIRDHWGEMQGYLGSVLRGQGMSKAIAEEMAVIPGMEEIVSLLHIRKQAEEGSFDRVIVDAAPTGETIRLLTMPESFQWYMTRLTGWGDTVTMRMAGAVLKRVMPEKDPFTSLDNLVDGVKELQKVLIDPAITSYRVVLNPEKMVLKEGARAVTYLALFGYPVDAAIVNRILPVSRRMPMERCLDRAQQRSLSASPSGDAGHGISSRLRVTSIHCQSCARAGPTSKWSASIIYVNWQRHSLPNAIRAKSSMLERLRKFSRMAKSSFCACHYPT
jgi:arsenite-transporting ATPase